MKNNDDLLVVIPMHAGKEIPTGTLLAIIKDAGLNKDDYIKLSK